MEDMDKTRPIPKVERWDGIVHHYDIEVPPPPMPPSKKERWWSKEHSEDIFPVCFGFLLILVVTLALAAMKFLGKF